MHAENILVLFLVNDSRGEGEGPHIAEFFGDRHCVVVAIRCCETSIPFWRKLSQIQS